MKINSIKGYLALTLSLLPLLIVGCGGAKKQPIVIYSEPEIFNTIPCEQLGAADARSPAHVNGGLPSALAGLYDRSCKICHENAQAGAPLKGNTEQWQPRLAKGMDVLLDHTINGYKGMPPMGLCMACSDEEFTILIGYMSGQQSGPVTQSDIEESGE